MSPPKPRRTSSPGKALRSSSPEKQSQYATHMDLSAIKPPDKPLRRSPCRAQSEILSRRPLRANVRIDTSEEFDESLQSPSSPSQAMRPNFLNLNSESVRDKYMFTPDEDDFCQSMPPMIPQNTPSADSSGIFTKDADSLSTTSKDSIHFTHHNQAYQSVNVTSSSSSQKSSEVNPMTSSDQDIPGKMFADKNGKQGLLKWRGHVFNADSSDEDDRSLEFESMTHSDNDRLLTVELNRGWSSRLGFSLKQGPDGTYISQIYPDSVAARDGRLGVGDTLLTVSTQCPNLLYYQSSRDDEKFNVYCLHVRCLFSL